MPSYGKQEPLVRFEDTGLTRRQWLAITSTLAGPALAGCTGTEDDDEPSPMGDSTSPSDGEPSSGTDTAEAEIQQGGTLTSTLETEVNNLDPAFGLIFSTYIVGYRVHEELFKVTENLDVAGWLAKDLEISDDGLNWTITLQEGVQFHPPYERELTADDIVYNYDRYWNPETGAIRRNFLNTIASWESTDRYTLEFSFNQVQASTLGWLSYLGNGIISPDAIEEMGDVKNHPVGTGPFKFEEWIPGDRIVLSRFEDYWQDGLPYLDEVIFRPIKEDAVKITELQSGNVDIVRVTPSDFIPRLLNDDSVTVKTVESGKWSLVELNPSPEPKAGRAPGTPTANRTIRQAIHEAIDRPGMVEIITGGYGTPTQNYFPKTSPWHIPYNPYTMGPNPQKAKQMIDDAGFDRPVKVEIMANAGSVSSQLGRIVQDNLKNAGFDPNLTEYEVGTWVEKLFAHEYDINCDQGAAYTDPDLIRQFFDEDYIPFFNYDNDVTLGLWDDLRRTQGRDERLAIWEELQKELIDEAVMVPLYHPFFVMTHRNEVKNFRPEPYTANYWLKEVWLDQS